jgi:glycosyltransferase involved in cell wall biosynthesis
MKILFCINKLGSGSGLGGAERLIVDDINEMNRLGYSVRLLTLRNESKFSIAEEVELPKQYWQTINFSGFFNVTDWIKVYKYFKKEKPDIVFSHLWFSNTIIRIVCKIVGVKNVFSFEHNVYETVKSNKHYFVDRLLQQWSKKIIAVSSAVKISLIKNGIRQEKIIVINNGINLSKYTYGASGKLREELGIGDSTIVFLTIGRLIHQKGIDILLQAFAKIPKESVLVIVGQGTDELSLKKLAVELGIDKRVYFLGIRHDIPNVLSMCDVFVLASRYEGLGIVVLEAMASKKPIIISDFEAGKDMIDSGINGLVVKKEGVDDLTQAMERLTKDSLLRVKLGEMAYYKVQNFSIENHVNKLMSLW